jgi:Flp pilus assembly protein TadG
MTGVVRFLGRFRRANEGMAAIEMSLVGVLLSGALINAVDIGRYGVALMQVNNAAQAGAAAAYRTCDAAHVPATQNCPALASAVQTAVASTSLGENISLKDLVTEGWYCVTPSNRLQFMAAPSSKPTDCSAANNASASPGLYLGVRVQYGYEPIFPGLTLAGSLPTPIDKTAWARMQ